MSYCASKEFVADIARMNATYELPPINTLFELVQRLPNFKVILGKEFAELEDIERNLNTRLLNTTEDAYLPTVVEFADLLGDIVVYCFSEAARHDIPLFAVLAVIMSSNFTKLGVDGKPIKDENGKFLKGPNFVPPEPAIENILRTVRRLPTIAINYQSATTPESPVPDSQS